MRVIAVVCAILIGSLLSTTAHAQNLSKHTKDISSEVLKNPNSLLITGKVKDIVNDEILTNREISLNKESSHLIDAAIDENGYYLLVLDKTKVNFPFRLKMKVDGYKKFTARHIEPSSDIVHMDILLRPERGEDASQPGRVMKLSDSPYSTLVIQF